jgi:hypothetical protein
MSFTVMSTVVMIVPYYSNTFIVQVTELPFYELALGLTLK